MRCNRGEGTSPPVCSASVWVVIVMRSSDSTWVGAQPAPPVSPGTRTHLPRTHPQEISRAEWQQVDVVPRVVPRHTRDRTATPAPSGSLLVASPAAPFARRMATHRLRVNMERLLAACERMAASELHEKPARRRYETYLKVLQRYWHELASATHGTDKWLGEYRRKIEHLTDLVDEEKLRSSVPVVAHSRAHDQPHLSRKQANEELSCRLQAANRVQSELRRELVSKLAPAAGSALAATLQRASALPPLPPGAPSAGEERGGEAASDEASGGVRARRKASQENGEAGGAHDGGAAARRGAAAAVHDGGVGARGGVDGRVEEARPAEMDRLHDVQRQLQESLIDETAQMAAELRERSLLARKAIAADCSTLASTDAVIDSNQSAMDTINPRLQEQLKRMKQSSCNVWLMMLVVAILFIVTFFMMKLFPKRKHAPPIQHAAMTPMLP
ncbi:hypothetical protein AB1Y20_019764 [Prymnesium parvum]|uniref:Vesicle transport protein USE1 n=1 Tax=Prymnesium parvum TaxID=97485 RepID=A0AB34JTA8_PRYPA